MFLLRTTLREDVMDWLFAPENWIALLTLTALEVVLGIDNVIFISILAGKLPEAQ
jgi:predicted tellurium resistance membrane protein TerC